MTKQFSSLSVKVVRKYLGKILAHVQPNMKRSQKGSGQGIRLVQPGVRISILGRRRQGRKRNGGHSMDSQYKTALVCGIFSQPVSEDLQGFSILGSSRSVAVRL